MIITPSDSHASTSSPSNIAVSLLIFSSAITSLTASPLYAAKTSSLSPRPQTPAVTPSNYFVHWPKPTPAFTSLRIVSSQSGTPSLPAQCPHPLFTHLNVLFRLSTYPISSSFLHPLLPNHLSPLSLT